MERRMEEHEDTNDTVLATYDPNWSGRWEQTHRLLKAMGERREFGPDYDLYSRALHEAYYAQFRTVKDVWEHDLKWAPSCPAGLDVAIPQLPARASVADVNRVFKRYREDVEAAEEDRDRPAPVDPPGLIAFTTPAQPGCERHVEQLTLEGSGDGQAVHCLLALEVTVSQAHVCFIWQKDGGSVCNEVERLATHVYRDRFASGFSTSRWRRLLVRKGEHFYSPASLSFYEYDPWHLKSAGLRYDACSLVSLTWAGRLGFTDPKWVSCESVPPYLVSVSMPGMRSIATRHVAIPRLGSPAIANSAVRPRLDERQG